MALFGTLGIRSQFNDVITPEFSEKIANAYGVFTKGKKVIVGYDARTSNTCIKKAVISGLLSAGCDVIDVGLSPSPTIQWAVKKLGAAGAVVVTASHNPREYNGLKFTDSEGDWLNKEQESIIERTYFENRVQRMDENSLGTLSTVSDLNEIYIDATLEYVSPFVKRPLKVIVDCANSVGALTTPQILQKMGCSVTVINGELDGAFPGRAPEPSLENLSYLLEQMKSGEFDIAFAHDGDADRLISVDERGTFIFGDQSFALVADYVLSKYEHSQLVMPINTSNALREIAKKYNTKLFETKIGELNIVDTIRKIGKRNTFAGEENGGLIFPNFCSCRNGPLAAAVIIKILCEKNKSYSTLISELPEYSLIKENIHIKDLNILSIITHLKKKYATYELITIDGLKIVFDSESWIIIRPSGTEPVIRIFSEAKTKDAALKRCEEIKKEIFSLKK